MFGTLKKIGAFLRGGRTSFNAFELAVLEAVSLKMNPLQVARLKQRISAINFVAVLDGGREINAYDLKNGQSVIDDTSKIEHSTGERRFATFVINGPVMTQNTGAIWLVDGRFFSIEFADPTEHAEANEITSIEVTLCAPSAQS